jgi:hypothetical protein
MAVAAPAADFIRRLVGARCRAAKLLSVSGASRKFSGDYPTAPAIAANSPRRDLMTMCGTCVPRAFLVTSAHDDDKGVWQTYNHLVGPHRMPNLLQVAEHSSPS